MLLSVTTAGWRLPDATTEFEHTRALRPESHLELNWYEGDSGTTLTEVWVDLYVTEPEPLRKWMLYRRDVQRLEWRFAFEGPDESLAIPMDWNRVDEEAGEVTLLNPGVPPSLLDELGIESTVS